MFAEGRGYDIIDMIILPRLIKKLQMHEKRKEANRVPRLHNSLRLLLPLCHVQCDTRILHLEVASIILHPVPSPCPHFI